MGAIILTHLTNAPERRADVIIDLELVEPFASSFDVLDNLIESGVCVILELHNCRPC